jgi:NADH:ubiquinone oxidoreductase subunit 3 (subunit A)
MHKGLITRDTIIIVAVLAVVAAVFALFMIGITGALNPQRIERTPADESSGAPPYYCGGKCMSEKVR